ncbi:MAG TPA: phage major capsid protein [Promineifilum sp.]
MDIQKLREAYNAKIAEAKQLTAGGDVTPEVAEKVNGLLGQADELKVQIDMALRMADAEAFAAEPAGTKAAHHGWRQAGPDEGMPVVDYDSWREVKAGAMTLRVYIPEAVTTKGYDRAFEAYMRKGKADMGPADRKTLSVGSDSAGGFLVPEDYHVELIKKTAVMATIRANARVAQTSRDMAKWPRINYTTDDKYTSGVRLTWTGETPSSATVHRVTDPVFGLLTVPVHTAMASMPITNNLLEDSAFDVLGVSSDLLGEAFALGENDAFINGTGVSRPMGILAQVGTSDGPGVVNSGSAGTLTSTGLINIAYELAPQYERNAKWFMSKSTEKVIRKIVGTTSGEYSWPVENSVGALGPVPPSLLGFGIVREQFMPDMTTDAHPIVFGDLRGYLVLDRVGLSLQRLDELYAETDITVLLARRRVGGQLIEPWRVKAQKVAS